jgi:hypothetical protein
VNLGEMTRAGSPILRGFCVTTALPKGISLPTVQKILGHEQELQACRTSRPARGSFGEFPTHPLDH